MESKHFQLASDQLKLEYSVTQKRLQLQHFGTADANWLAAATSGMFAVEVDGRRYDSHNLSLQDFKVDQNATDWQEAIATFAGPDFTVEHHLRLYENSALLESWQIIRATATETLHITRLDSFGLDVASDTYEVLYFTSDWGQEFEPVRHPLQGNLLLETRKGRSSKGQHPWFALFRADGKVLSGSVAWSGNWVCRFEALETGGYHLSGGLHDWSFSKTLRPGQATESAHMILAAGDNLNDVSQQYAQVGRRFWYPRNDLSETLPVEWNHWWSYEDRDINETVFLDNISAAAKLGIDICTLDAGWFGPSSAGAEWHQFRGDWDLVNRERFPNGVRALADAAHAQGMKFGLWCEIEGLGKQAALAEKHPDFPALRDGATIGQVCFGNPEAREWAFQTLSRLIREYDADWIKLDFNLDPEAGCNRTDHGHGAEDGLYEHLQGYYSLLERVRAAFPNVVLENCASGGLRIDLGILKHTHMTFLSDPDWPVHDLQIFWGATTMLAPNACLHWSYSQWRKENPYPLQKFDAHDPNLTQTQFDYYTRIGMLGATGFSQKLPELPAWVAARLADHIRIYKTQIRRFVREAVLYRLTEQPRRDGTGDRWCAFQYSLPDRTVHLLFVFRLPGAEAERSIKLLDLEPERIYQIEGLEGERTETLSGQELMEQGIVFNHLVEEGSALLRLT